MEQGVQCCSLVAQEPMLNIDPREFMSRFAPQLAYANPAIPISLERRPESRNASWRSDASKIQEAEANTNIGTEVTINFRKALLPKLSSSDNLTFFGT